MEQRCHKKIANTAITTGFVLEHIAYRLVLAFRKQRIEAVS